MVKQKIKYNPTVLIVIDGWGIAPDSPGNAISKAKTPNMDKLSSTYPTAVLVSSGDAVGLRWGEQGNSEVGHLNIGAGLVFYQNLPLINSKIKNKEFFSNETLLKAVEHVRKNKSKFHVMGLVSGGGVHSHNDHLGAIFQFCHQQKIKEVYLHAFLDGRDAIFNSGVEFLSDVEKMAHDYKINLHICDISGRAYAMDRDNRWEKVGLAYNAMIHGKGELSEKSAIATLEDYYKKEIFDEQVVPTVLTENGKPIRIVEDGDSLVFFNFRSDRAREITKAIAVPHFDKVEKKEFKDLFIATMVEYDKSLPVEVMYYPPTVKNPIAKVISDAGLSQLHIAETEKYAHVTFFINGGTEEEFKHEDRKMIPSPKVASYDLKPEMRAKEIADETIKSLQADKYDFYIVNFANPDMVAHTGNLKASVKAVETVDAQIGRISEVVLAKGGLCAITADHGNAEEVINLQTGEKDTEHSTNPVPFIIIAHDLEGQNFGLPEIIEGDLSLTSPTGVLADVAPTLIKLMGLKTPDEMTGSSLI